MLSTKKKIIWQAHEGNISGANIALLEYVDALKDDYVFHVILPHNGTMCGELDKRSVAYHIIPQYGWAGDKIASIKSRAKFAIRSLLALRTTRKLIRHLQPEFFFTNSLSPFIGAKAAFKEGLAHVWWIHEFGEEDFGFRIGLGEPGKAYRNMQQWSRVIVCNSKAVAAKYSQLMPAAKILVNYQPVSWKASGLIQAKKGRFLMFGQITASKGHLDVIKAMQLNKENGKQVYPLHIIGPCENVGYYEELLQVIASAGLQDRVTIERGFFEKETVLPQFEVLIVASRSEAFGRVIVEAGKAGLRVMVRNSGGAPELINHTNGLLYNNQQELAAVLSGEQQLPSGELVMNYSEEAAINELKQTLSALV